MRINIFRNPFIDVQVGYLIDNMVDARRKETESYWREIIERETVNRIKYRLEDESCAVDCEICEGIDLALMIIDDEFGYNNEL